MQKKRNNGIFVQIMIIVTVLAVIGIICFFVYEKSNVRVEDNTKGMQILSELSQKDVSEVEAKMKSLPTGDKSGETVLAKFRGSVIMGDSIAQELIEYQVLDESVVIADIGISIPDTAKEVEIAVSMSPQHVFLSYGLNDMITTGGDTDLFKTEYKGLLEELESKLPDAKIYVNSILPVQEDVLEEKPLLGKNAQYNEVLEQLCESEGVTFINNLDLVREDIYEQDGIHMHSEYYESWVLRMAEVAGL